MAEFNMRKPNPQPSETAYKPLVHPDKHPNYNHTGFNRGKFKIPPKGHVKEPGFQAFPTSVLWERDRPVGMRDGVTLFGDVFRPMANEKVPAIIPWSPYGKAGTGTLNYDAMGPFRMGIPYPCLSGYETFEGPNPVEWCSRGYAIVDIDARGAGHSEGNVVFWGEQEALGIYDAITWAAKQQWCNGSVVMMGNSWLAISQINFASRFRHPNLKAIAPWEALTNFYAQQACRGGIPNTTGFIDMIISGFAGFGSVEDIGAMTRKHPFFDEYWKKKLIQPKNIHDVPMYLTASYSTGFHCEGSFQTFEQASTSKKWLRIHATQEWHDLYRPEAKDDLQRFFDFYAKGIKNRWEKETPKVRLSLLAYDGSSAKSVIERPKARWPPRRYNMQRYYLNAATKLMQTSQPIDVASTIHEGHSLTESSDFILKFDKYTELSGRPFANLYMSCSEGTDFDVVIQIRKISSTGKPLASLNWSPMPKPEPEVPDVNVAKHLGQQGMLRASLALH
ncbi:Alpha/Beta hydrolase protein [Aspergillus cavernicola]|uniref:Alpha/Beta hydrolase protein n=1 Tax=Aspergillus cavernicola TaxID=176166 RepID=A0ABR4J1H6_9EURO